MPSRPRRRINWEEVDENLGHARDAHTVYEGLKPKKKSKDKTMLKEAYESGFSAAFEKLASTRYSREMAKKIHSKMQDTLKSDGAGYLYRHLRKKSIPQEYTPKSLATAARNDPGPATRKKVTPPTPGVFKSLSPERKKYWRNLADKQVERKMSIDGKSYNARRESMKTHPPRKHLSNMRYHLKPGQSHMPEWF